MQFIVTYVIHYSVNQLFFSKMYISELAEKETNSIFSYLFLLNF